MHEGKGEHRVPPAPTDTSWMQGLLGTMVDLVVFLVIALAPAIPYLKQYAIIKARKDVGAFSVYVCAIMLYGQAFRILFWYPVSEQIGSRRGFLLQC